MKKQCVNDPNDLDWVEYWQERLEGKKNKDWDKAAPEFYKRAKKDDYQNELLSNMILSKNDTVLDVGCGEGSSTIPLAKKVKSVTGLDSSVKMLEFLNKRAKENNISNVDTILKPIEDISYEEIGDYDIVVASRSLNGIVPIEKTISELNKIANKYVFLTVFGPNDRKIVKDFEICIWNNSQNSFPEYNYLFNILFNMGIYPNIKRLELSGYRKYETIEEVIYNGKFRPDLMNDEEKDKLKSYLKKVMKKDPETGKLYSELDMSDWILFWWKI